MRIRLTRNRVRTVMLALLLATPFVSAGMQAELNANCYRSGGWESDGFHLIAFRDRASPYTKSGIINVTYNDTHISYEALNSPVAVFLMTDQFKGTQELQTSGEVQAGEEYSIIQLCKQLPNTQQAHEVPEFGTVAVTLTTILCGALVMMHRRR